MHGQKNIKLIFGSLVRKLSLHYYQPFGQSLNCTDLTRVNLRYPTVFYVTVPVLKD